MPSRNGQQGSYVSPYQVSLSYGDDASAMSQNPGADWFGPLTPIKPLAPPAVAGRQWDYPAGFNLNTTPRIHAPITFATLRGLADGYDLLRLLIETRKDQIARMAWTIKPRQANAGAQNDAALKAVTAFLKRPDHFHNWDDWLRIVLEDLFVIDAPALYMQRDRAGNLLGMLPLDGATIKPVIDDWGRTPQPYIAGGKLVYPTAYQQVLKGFPAVDYSVRDLIYRPRNLRVNRAYGFSPVEQLIATVNIALRKQLFTLEYYTSGNIPDSLIGVPDTWTPDQIASYQNYWDAYIEGDLGRRRKAKFVPGGMSKTFIQTKEPELKSDFDEWLVRICCFAFSISPQAFVKQMNRASAETQKELSEEEGLAPILKWIKSLMDDVIEREFGAPQLEFVWSQDSGLDPIQQETMLSGYVKSGILTLNEARSQLGREACLDPAADRLMTLTASGYVAVSAGESADPQSPRPEERPRDASRRTSGVWNLHGEEPRSGVSNPHVEKFSPDQPRVSAGNGRASGQWTSSDSGASASAAALITGRSVASDAPNLTPVQFLPPIEGEPVEPGESERTSEEATALALSAQRVRDALKAVSELDPNWRPPDQLTATDAAGRPSVADQLTNSQEIIAAAQARVNELQRQRADFPGEPPLDRSNMQDKLQNYALNQKNEQNRGKAAWFEQVLGFDQSNWQELADQIYFDESIAVPEKQSRYGQTYSQVISIRGANGRVTDVEFGFIKTDTGVVRLTTAMPTPK